MAALGTISAKNGDFLTSSWQFTAKSSPGMWAWMALGAGVLAYNITAKEGQLLSEAADRGITRHPLLARLTIAVVAAHVANMTPSRLDPIHLFFTVLRKIRKQPKH